MDEAREKHYKHSAAYFCVLARERSHHDSDRGEHK
jgi:hypothetical protein